MSKMKININEEALLDAIRMGYVDNAANISSIREQDTEAAIISNMQKSLKKYKKSIREIIKEISLLRELVNRGPTKEVDGMHNWKESAIKCSRLSAKLAENYAGALTIANTLSVIVSDNTRSNEVETQRDGGIA